MVWLRVRRANENPNARRGARVRSGHSSQVSGSRASASGRSPAGETPSSAFGVRFPGSVPDGGEHQGWVPPNLYGRTQTVLSPRRRHLACPEGDVVTATKKKKPVALPSGRERRRGVGVRAHCCPSPGT